MKAARAGWRPPEQPLFGMNTRREHGSLHRITPIQEKIWVDQSIITKLGPKYTTILANKPLDSAQIWVYVKKTFLLPHPSLCWFNHIFMKSLCLGYSRDFGGRKGSNSHVTFFYQTSNLSSFPKTTPRTYSKSIVQCNTNIVKSITK